MGWDVMRDGYGQQLYSFYSVPTAILRERETKRLQPVLIDHVVVLVVVVVVEIDLLSLDQERRRHFRNEVQQQQRFMIVSLLFGRDIISYLVDIWFR